MNAKVKRQHENSNENCIPHVEGQSGDLEDIKKNQISFLEMKSIIQKIKKIQ